MVKKHTKKRGITNGWKFLMVVLVIYGISGLINASQTSRAIGAFTQLLDTVLPALALIFLLIFSIDLFLNPKRIETYLGQQSGIKGWLVAIIGGILSTGPVYAWYALLSELKQKGMRPSLVAVFLYSRAVKLPLLPLLVHYFGIRYTIVLILYLIIFSLIGGLAMEKIEDKSPMENKP
jgi:uncharacterized membrane protein YraQ (UPF0718 family)